MRLDHWLSHNSITADQFGDLIGTTGEAVRNWRLGKRMPEPETAEAIVKATNGQVTVQDLHDARLDYKSSVHGRIATTTADHA